MKKILSFLFALIFSISMMNAQTVVRNGVFSNMYVGISGGVTTGTVTAPIANFNAPVDFKTLPYNAALEIGKNVTPITGFSLNTYARPDFTNGFEMKRLDITGNTKFNLMNLFGGYNGRPRVFEVQTVTGIGLEYKFNATNNNPWDMGLNVGLEFDFNLGQNRAWYITLTPMVTAHEIILHSQQIQDMAEAAELQANLGVAYRFGSRKTGSHNFVICPYTRTEDEYNELCAQYDECMNRPVETIVDTVIVERIVEVEKVVEGSDTNGVLNVITFPKNSSTIPAVEMQQLEIIMQCYEKDQLVVIIGSADSKTGNEQYNLRLAQLRADAVAKVFTDNGFTNVETDTKLDAFDATELSRCAIITK
jgi:outer membrane protein OmpA-like peptidoglycan-associated protein